jgi:hypothetical protein
MSLVNDPEYLDELIRKNLDESIHNPISFNAYTAEEFENKYGVPLDSLFDQDFNPHSDWAVLPIHMDNPFDIESMHPSTIQPISVDFTCDEDKNMPDIQQIIYNGTHTVVKWSDGKTTVVNCREGDEFNKEVGLAMAIARKYFERVSVDTPRAEFLHAVENARTIEPKE